MFDTLYSYQGKTYISSIEWYNHSGLNRTNYSKWATRNIVEIGRRGVDYLPMGQVLKKSKGRPPLDFALTVPFAISLCRISKHKVALRMIETLEGLNH